MATAGASTYYMHILQGFWVITVLFWFTSLPGKTFTGSHVIRLHRVIVLVMEAVSTCGKSVNICAVQHPRRQSPSPLPFCLIPSAAHRSRFFPCSLTFLVMLVFWTPFAGCRANTDMNAFWRVLIIANVNAGHMPILNAKSDWAFEIVLRI